MGNFYQSGRDDSGKGRVYGWSLPGGTRPNDESRATYRAGWIAAESSQGFCTLPASFMQLNGRAYWIVALTGDGNPVYQVTSGTIPECDSGYYNLAALMALKGDSFA